jgi:RNA polymerase sigma-54 factor
MNNAPPLADAEQALRIVQSFDPKGVAARNLQECLLLQLDRNDPDYSMQQKLIVGHLLDIENNRFPKIAKETGADIDTVKRAIAYICSLHPAPGRLYDTEMIPYVVPDVLVGILDGEYVVALDDTNIPRLRVSQMYRDMLKESERNSDAREYLRKKIESARWLIDSIEQRRSTLLKVSREIVRAQRSFFDEGISALRPLKMQEVADATSMHVATVSRAVRHKYMQTPRGIFPMKFFFTGGMASGDGEVQAWDSVKQRIKEIVDAEDKAHPLSDDDITERLHADGNVAIARRTVTKYRKALDLPSSRQRRKY